ncbi:baculoviral IAP repeat-containing protein 3-like [Paramacrobiotus metropolitanus]|uniref:baculoviral IAP repeat-containing protein 3-like n=1 Tax=Paramacrobiotus metropolitanus TaxID=2943436 RepID=UPI0024461585|nr:baculoviral IAP repeat-containing protein 3-like [Paramacrobiotus metropolitanus]XP_055351717.1 baculoviral IAP repeat-containing protein 3-like [Paramacrobiotus metropolitanus]
MPIRDCPLTCFCLAVTPEARMSLEDRLKTFDKWPLAYVSPQSLAEAGFIYTGAGDEVKCVLCNIVHFNWMMGDQPKFEHRRINPDCAYAAMVADGELYFPAMKEYRDRFATYANWPGQVVSQRPMDMANAGFFFNEGVWDQVQCFCCGRKLAQWTRDDDPWIEHAKYEPQCAYLLEKKGLRFVREVRRLHDMDKLKWAGSLRKNRMDFLVAFAMEQGVHYTYLIKAVQRYGRFERIIDLVKKANVIKARTIEARLDENCQLEKECSVCLNKNVSICFAPCGHAICCVECSGKVRECPLCRQVILQKIKLFFA